MIATAGFTGVMVSIDGMPVWWGDVYVSASNTVTGFDRRSLGPFVIRSAVPRSEATIAPIKKVGTPRWPVWAPAEMRRSREPAPKKQRWVEPPARATRVMAMRVRY